MYIITVDTDSNTFMAAGNTLEEAQTILLDKFNEQAYEPFDTYDEFCEYYGCWEVDIEPGEAIRYGEW